MLHLEGNTKLALAQNLDVVKDLSAKLDPVVVEQLPPEYVSQENHYVRGGFGTRNP